MTVYFRIAPGLTKEELAEASRVFLGGPKPTPPLEELWDTYTLAAADLDQQAQGDAADQIGETLNGPPLRRCASCGESIPDSDHSHQCPGCGATLCNSCGFCSTASARRSGREQKNVIPPDYGLRGTRPAETTVYPCPHCGNALEIDADNLWYCPRCQRTYPNEVTCGIARPAYSSDHDPPLAYCDEQPIPQHRGWSATATIPSPPNHTQHERRSRRHEETR
jgi:Zn finger protein HypA/HybF involved in hydrogenase expression